MGKAKFVILAAIVLLVQIVSSAGFVKVSDNVIIKNAAAADDCDWPMFGRTPDGCREAPKVCGLTGNSCKVEWSFKTGGEILGACAISGDKVCFGSMDKNFYCLNAFTGIKNWTVQSKGIINTSPALSNDNVYFGDKFCLDLNTGNKKWEFIPNYNLYTSPIIVNDKIFIGGFESFYCFNIKNGAKLWEFKTGNICSSPVYSKGKVFFGSHDNCVYCLDAESGKLIWRFVTFWAETSSPVVVDDKVFFKAIFPESMMFCLNANDGSIVWSIEYKDKVTNSPAYSNGRLFLGSDDRKVYCYDAKNGKRIWEFKTGSWVTSSPAICSDRVYFGCDDGKVYCLDKEDGTKIWDFQTESTVRSSPVVSGGMVYVGASNGIFYCLKDDTVKVKNPTKIELIPSQGKVDTCKLAFVSAKVFDQNNQEIKGAKLEWSVEPNDIGTIDNTGIFKPAKTGVAKITCKCGDAVATVDINVVEFLSTSVKNLVLTNVKPYQVYKTTLTYTNNSDSKLNVKLTPSTELIKLDPSEFSIDAGKSMDVLVSCSLKEFVPSAVTNFTIDADYGGCPKSTPGTIINVDKYDCLTVTPGRLDFELVKRGNSKTLSLVLDSNAKQSLTITCDNPWVEISKKSLAMEVGQKESVDFKIMASSLPPSTKLSANIKISSDKDFCESFSITLTVMTEDSITIKLQVNSKNATINDQERTLDVPAQIVAGRTMVPLRFISESFGCSIQWDAVAQKISIIRYDITVNLWIGKDYVEVNGSRLKIDSPPMIIGGRTMVPLRFIAEPFGADVRWDAQTKGITIIWPKP